MPLPNALFPPVAPGTGSHNSCSKGSKNCLSIMIHGNGNCTAKPTESHHLLAGKCVRGWDIQKGKAKDSMWKATCLANGTIAAAEYSKAKDCSGKPQVHMFAANSCSKNMLVSTAGCASQGAKPPSSAPASPWTMLCLPDKGDTKAPTADT